MMEKTTYERNLLALALYNPVALRKLSVLPPEKDEQRLCFIKAKTGVLVPALTYANNTFPLHSTFNPEREGEKFKAIYKAEGVLLFLGLGAAYHVFPFLKESSVSSIIIIEESALLLRRILEKIDLHELFVDPRVYLLLDSSREEIKEFLLQHYIPALLGDLKSIPLWPRFNASKEYFKESLKIVEETIGKIADDYTVQAKFGKRWTINILNNLKLAEKTTLVIKPQRKVIITGAGPSLEDSVNEIKKIRKDYFLIASDTSFSYLKQNGIESDCILSIDCQQISYLHFLKYLPDEIPLLLDLASPPTLTRLAKKLFFFSTGHPFSQLINQEWRAFPQIDISGGNVVYAAVSLAKALGAEKIILFGVDYSYPEGKTYTRDTYLYEYFQSQENRFNTLQTFFCALIFRNRNLIVEKEKNFLRYTTRPLLSYKENLERLIKDLGIEVIHKRVKGLHLQFPKSQKTYYNKEEKLFCAGPAKMKIKDFLKTYKNNLESLKKPYNPVLKYLEELPQRERGLWTTLFPVLAFLRTEKKEASLDGAFLLDEARSFIINKISQIVDCLK